jgi:hypothetical protein
MWVSLAFGMEELFCEHRALTATAFAAWVVPFGIDQAMCRAAGMQ